MFGKGKVRLLSDATIRAFNIDPSTLQSGSHTKVVVECTRCGEVFNREYKNIGQLHGCPLRKTREDGVELKWCNRCQQFVAITLFSQNAARYSKLSSWCKMCESNKPSTIRHNLRRVLAKKSTLEGWLSWMVSNKRAFAKRNNIPFDLDAEWLKSKWDNQNGRCFYLDVPLEFNGGNRLFAATLERLDSSLGYTKSNTVFASRFTNLGKNNASYQDFQDAIAYILSRQNEVIRTEVKLQDLEAKLPTRSRTSDAGYDLYSLIDVDISPGDVVNIDTGMSVVAPIGYYFTIEGRSSMFKAGIVPFRGIIDGCYTGSMVVSLMNVGNQSYSIHKGDRIAQLIPHKIISMDMVIVQNISPDYDIRGNNGFGSSGR